MSYRKMIVLYFLFEHIVNIVRDKLDILSFTIYVSTRSTNLLFAFVLYIFLYKISTLEFRL